MVKKMHTLNPNVLKNQIRQIEPYCVTNRLEIDSWKSYTGMHVSPNNIVLDENPPFLPNLRAKRFIFRLISAAKPLSESTVKSSEQSARRRTSAGFIALKFFSKTALKPAKSSTFRLRVRSTVQASATVRLQVQNIWNIRSTRRSLSLLTG